MIFYLLLTFFALRSAQLLYRNRPVEVLGINLSDPSFDSGLESAEHVVTLNSSKTALEDGKGNSLKRAAKVTHSADQSIPSSNLTTLNFDTSIYNYGGMYDSGATDRLTVSEAGIYSIKANIGFDANTTGIRAVFIQKNGDSNNRIGSLKLNAPNSGSSFLPLSIDAELAATDYISLVVFQDSGGSLNVPSNTIGIRSPIFSMRRVW